jgi:hypothetical protein
MFIPQHSLVSSSTIFMSQASEPGRCITGCGFFGYSFSLLHSVCFVGLYFAFFVMSRHSPKAVSNNR